MKVFIFGNIASGKSTAAGLLCGVFPIFERLCVDDFRRKYGDGSMDKERIAKSAFVDSIAAGKNQIVEAMGTGDTGEALLSIASNLDEPMLVVIIKTDLEICKSRLSARIWDVPYPAPTSQAESLAEAMNPHFVDGTLRKAWKSVRGSVVFETECFDDDSLEIVTKIIKGMLI